jgi:RNA polymerase sigma-70 factor, ECF subfamily
MSHSDAAAALAARYHESLYGFALALAFRDRQEAWEIVQQVYMEVLEGRVDLASARDPRTFMLGVTRKIAASRRRKAYFGSLLGLKFQEQTAAFPIIDPERLAERSRTADRVREALKQLPVRQMEVATLVFQQDLSLEEAAGVMGVSIGAARRHYHRAKQKLAVLLKDVHGAER